MTTNAPSTLNSADLQIINKMIRAQRDRKQNVTVFNTINLNPQLITPTSNPVTYGPYYFNTQFAGNPVVLFGAYRNVQQDQVATGSTPFCAYAYVDSFEFKGGAIIGMNVGVYGLTQTPVGLTQYTLAWMAIGKGSAYKLESQSASYTQSYSSNQSGHLYSDTQAAGLTGGS